MPFNLSLTLFSRSFHSHNKYFWVLKFFKLSLNKRVAPAILKAFVFPSLPMLPMLLVAVGKWKRNFFFFFLSNGRSYKSTKRKIRLKQKFQEKKNLLILLLSFSFSAQTNKNCLGKEWIRNISFITIAIACCNGQLHRFCLFNCHCLLGRLLLTFAKK